MIESMVAVNEIESFCQRLAVEYRPRRIVLFGKEATQRKLLYEAPDA